MSQGSLWDDGPDFASRQQAFIAQAEAYMREHGSTSFHGEPEARKPSRGRLPSGSGSPP